MNPHRMTEVYPHHVNRWGMGWNSQRVSYFPLLKHENQIVLTHSSGCGSERCWQCVLLFLVIVLSITFCWHCWHWSNEHGGRFERFPFSLIKYGNTILKLWRDQRCREPLTWIAASYLMLVPTSSTCPLLRANPMISYLELFDIYYRIY